jgi:hypothetical protein
MAIWRYGVDEENTLGGFPDGRIIIVPPMNARKWREEKVRNSRRSSAAIFSASIAFSNRKWHETG